MNSHIAYGSHIYVLLPCLYRSSGSILEIGVGHTSSVLCNLFSMYSGRRCLALENNRAWLNEMKAFLPENPHRESVHSMYEPYHYEGESWGLAFVDAPDDYRVRAGIISGPLARKARIVICHDSENPVVANAAKVADLEEIPRPYDNMRASRNTEVEKRFGPKVEAEWIDHTTKTAFDHYLMVMEDDFTDAAGWTTGKKQ